jgi:hypothetical protein
VRAATGWYMLDAIPITQPTMPLSIRNARAKALARYVAARRLLRIAKRINRRRTRDRRTPEVILGYDRHGLPR